LGAFGAFGALGAFGGFEPSGLGPRRGIVAAEVELLLLSIGTDHDRLSEHLGLLAAHPEAAQHAAVTQVHLLAFEPFELHPLEAFDVHLLETLKALQALDLHPLKFLELAKFLEFTKLLELAEVPFDVPRNTAQAVQLDHPVFTVAAAALAAARGALASGGTFTTESLHLNAFDLPLALTGLNLHFEALRPSSPSAWRKTCVRRFWPSG
jgi:hypothetical protein